MSNLTLAVGLLLLLSLGLLVFVWLRYRREAEARRAVETRFGAIIRVEEEKARVLRELAAERERIARELTAERERVAREIESAMRDLDGEKARAAQQIEASRRADDERSARLAQEHEQAGGEIARLRGAIAELQAEHAALDEAANLRAFGYYEPHWDLESSARYAERLEEIREQQRTMLKEKRAAVCRTVWHVSGSKAEGKRMTDRTLKLMLRAFNGESDAAISRVRYNNVHVMETRIRKAWEAINKTGEVQQCEIVRAYLTLRLDELSLAHEYQEKLQEEKEEQRRIREQMREEEVAQREFERAQADAEKEERRFETALEKARLEAQRAVGERQQQLLAQVEELQRRLDEAHARKERAIARAQLTRSGHVYVISNLGSFGEHVYKIGMTRRLDPQDRIRELGDASVPFQFDVHAVIYSDDAPALETAIHRLFRSRRVNRVNERKEFFHVTLDEIEAAVRQNHGEVEFLHVPEAEEYRKTLSLIQEAHHREPTPENRFFLERGLRIVQEPVPGGVALA